MKHIKYILAERKSTLFITQPEKGTDEWNTFRAVRHDLNTMGISLVHAITQTQRTHAAVHRRAVRTA